MQQLTTGFGLKAALLLYLLIPSCNIEDTYSAQVIGVADGDTITVLHQGRPKKIRLQAIDCPEKNQPFGTRAKQFTAELVFNTMVQVKKAAMDRYGRTVGWVSVDDKSLNAELLRAGLAWHYRQYDKSEQLDQLEREARESKRGLWADPNPMPPWQWRHRPKVALKPIATGHKKKENPPNTQGLLHGNVKSKKLHRSGCQGYNCKNCTAVFSSKEEALQAGYKPCKLCTP